MTALDTEKPPPKLAETADQQDGLEWETWLRSGHVPLRVSDERTVTWMNLASLNVTASPALGRTRRGCLGG